MCPKIGSEQAAVEWLRLEHAASRLGSGHIRVVVGVEGQWLQAELSVLLEGIHRFGWPLGRTSGAGSS